MSGNIKIILLTVVIFIFYTQNQADVVILKNENAIKGIIESRTETKIHFYTSGGIIVIPTERIKELKEDSRQNNSIIRAELLLFEGNLAQAINAYTKAIEQGASSTEIQTSIVQNEGNIFSRLRSLDNQSKESIVAFFERLLEDNAAQPDFTFLTAQLFFHLEHRQKVFPLLVSLPPDYYKSQPKKKEFAVSYFSQLIQDLLKSEDFKQAFAHIEKINNIAPELGRSSELLLYLNWAAKKREENKFKEALEIYQEKILPDYPEIARNRILFTLNTLVQWAIETQQFDYALSLVKPFWEQYPPGEIRRVLLDLYRHLGENLMEQGKIDEARDIFNHYYNLKGEAEEKTFHHLCDYYEQRQKISADDAFSHYKLGQLCVEYKLFDLAKEEFAQAAAEPQLKENVELQLKLLEEKQQVQLLEKVAKLYQQEKYFDAMDMGQAFLEKFPNSALRKEAEEMISLAQHSLVNEQQKRPYMAEVYYQQAERFYFMNKFKEAAEKLNLILSDYSDVPAAKKARPLARRLVTMAKLHQLEHHSAEPSSIPKITISEQPSDKDELANEIRTLLEVINP